MTLFRDGECEPLRRWPEWAQIAGFTACALFINVVIGLLIAPLGFTGGSHFKNELIGSRGVLFAFLLLVIAGPFMETIYGQWLADFVARIARRSPLMRLLWSACWFAILHLAEGLLTVFQTFGVGWVLASCFMFCHEEGWLKAYRVTSITHALHNLVVFVVF